jgi:hypothetical protein
VGGRDPQFDKPYLIPFEHEIYLNNLYSEIRR